MISVKKKPATVVLSRVWGIGNPFYPGDGDDLETPLKIGNRLFRVHPVGIKKKPRGQRIG